MNTIKEGLLKEVEPVGNVYVGIATIESIFHWKHKLPQEQK